MPPATPAKHENRLTRESIFYSAQYATGIPAGVDIHGCRKLRGEQARGSREGAPNPVAAHPFSSPRNPEDEQSREFLKPGGQRFAAAISRPSFSTTFSLSASFSPAQSLSASRLGTTADPETLHASNNSILT